MNKRTRLICIHGPVTKDYNEFCESYKNYHNDYNDLFDLCVKMIKSREFHTNEIDNMFDREMTNTTNELECAFD